ncbi:MAG: BlaI/MecI/CopY family transcriptional regulator, partial [Bacteroidota bacterium]
AEEEIMQIVWKLERCTVRDIIEEIAKVQSKPPHSTISSIARILDDKGFLGHKAYGRTYEYFALISKEAYSRFTLTKLASDYFGGSMNRLVSFLVKDDALDKGELNTLLDQLDEEE